jgi:hypothetical protein
MMSSEKYDGMLGRIFRDEGMALVEDNSGLWKEVAKGGIDDWFEAQPVNTYFVSADDMRPCNSPTRSPASSPYESSS